MAQADFAGTWGRQRAILPAQHLGSAIFVDSYRFHGAVPSQA